MQYRGATEGALMIPVDNAKFGSDGPGVVVVFVEAVCGKGKENFGCVTGAGDSEWGRVGFVAPALVFGPNCSIFSLGSWGQGIEVRLHGHW